jgi:uncharacterized SAM-binding protein YcdF (DUF218 family)
MTATRRSWRLTAATCGAIALVLLLGGYAARTPILRWIGAQLVHADSLAASDAIAVLAGGTPGREIEAADLYVAGYAPEIVLTTEPESTSLELLRKRGIKVPTALEQRLWYLTQLGVPAERVTVLDEERVTSTNQEAYLLVRWAERRRARSLIVVTSRFHSARARYTLGRAFASSPVVVRVRPASADDFDPETWWRDRATLRTGIFEWQRLILYRLRY